MRVTAPADGAPAGRDGRGVRGLAATNDDAATPTAIGSFSEALWEPTEGVAQNGQAPPYSYRIEPHCEQLFITCPFCAADVPSENSKGAGESYHSGAVWRRCEKCGSVANVSRPPARHRSSRHFVVTFFGWRVRLSFRFLHHKKRWHVHFSRELMFLSA